MSEKIEELKADLLKYKTALDKINVVRNSIVATQSFNFSEHAYQLVAALNEAGIVGMPYPEALKCFGSMLDRTNAAESQVAQLTQERDEARLACAAKDEALKAFVERHRELIYAVQKNWEIPLGSLEMIKQVAHAFSHTLGADLWKELEGLREDRSMLDWVEKQSDGSSWMARQSETGRGFRVHNTGKDSSGDPMARSTARGAIRVAMATEGFCPVCKMDCFVTRGRSRCCDAQAVIDYKEKAQP